MDPEMGGVCQAVRMIIAGFNKSDVENEVASLDTPGAAYLANDRFPVHAVGLGKGPWCYNNQLFIWLNTNLCRFDVVILHGLWLYPGHALRKALNLLQKENKKTPEFFIMPHGMLDPYFQKASGRKLKAIRNYLFWQVIERKIVSDADGLLFTCEMEKLLARKTFKGYYPKKELVVGLGVESPPLYQENMSIAFRSTLPNVNMQNFLLYISRIHEKKGIDILIKAYSNLKETQVDIPALVIAGPGLETEYGRMIKDMASKSRDVFFTGMLTGDAKWGAFYGCEAFVLPSHQENFGIAVVEAMACQKPVLISDQVNIWKEVLDSGGGLVAEDTLENTQLMLEAWIGLPKEEQLLMGQKAKTGYENNFAIQATSFRLKEAIIVK
ncbi:MAG: glycosyltransferase [Pyrinomonadaceae bacterium]|nr:glycosyltransferase [Sphingobacteriaceae bacterium]